MKDTLKDIGSILIDTCLSLLLIILFGHALLCLLVYNASAAEYTYNEVLTKEERVVALTILGEARGEGTLGMYAVGCVIQQRGYERKLTPAQVCRQPWQFEIWNAGKGKVKEEKELQHLWKSPSVPYARKLAQAICLDALGVEGRKLKQKVTGSANHYYSKSLDKPPYWAFKTVTKNGKKIKVPIKPSATIKNHIFYKLP